MSASHDSRIRSRGLSFPPKRNSTVRTMWGEAKHQAVSCEAEAPRRRGNKRTIKIARKGDMYSRVRAKQNAPCHQGSCSSLFATRRCFRSSMHLREVRRRAATPEVIVRIMFGAKRYKGGSSIACNKNTKRRRTTTTRTTEEQGVGTRNSQAPRSVDD